MSRLLLTTERLALFGTLLASFGELHPLCDPWVQGPKTASRKRLYGEDLVHADGSPATPDSTRPTMTTSTLAAARWPATSLLSGSSPRPGRVRTNSPW
ncbi:hypothetical protein [Streptomyces sp. MMS24-I29]|uniref:hypothetical protein n=1 Tax=Streptomyces sp. MMS24-I29 TaxID=3351480 RepID=UPI003C7E2C66